jgi:hypothetical protein
MSAHRVRVLAGDVPRIGVTSPQMHRKLSDCGDDECSESAAALCALEVVAQSSSDDLRDGHALLGSLLGGQFPQFGLYAY